MSGYGDSTSEIGNRYMSGMIKRQELQCIRSQSNNPIGIII